MSTEWSERVADHRAARSPCVHCPWRVENHGKRHPSGWYTKKNRRSLWSKLRRGENMTCHPTDPRNPVTDADRAAGYRPAPAESVTRECAGAIILQQREAHIFNALVEADPDGNGTATYRLLRGGLAMTVEGLIAAATRAVFSWPGEVPMRRDHNLSEPVAVDAGVLPWDPEKEEPWS